MIPLSNLAPFLPPDLAKTYNRVKQHIDAKTGIIPWLKEIPTNYAGDLFHIYQAKHPIIAQNDKLFRLLRNLESTSSAIGSSREEAMMLAICEALERWSCVTQGNEISFSYSYNQLRDRAIHPALLHGYSTIQYDNRVQNNIEHPTGGGYIPESLDLDLQVNWCPVYDLVNQEWKYILKSSCYYGCSDGNRVFSVADSRGVAAGPNKAFCIWNGLLELVETDAGAIWNANRIKCPAIDIESFNNPFFESIKDLHERLDRDLWAIDISMDVAGVVVIAVISRDRLTDSVIKGFGSHPIPERALQKALMECCQMLPNVIEDEISQKDGAEPTYRPRPNRREELCLTHFKPNDNLPIRQLADYPNSPSIKTSRHLVSALTRVGVTPMIHDATRPELGLHVLRILAPGMRSWFNRRAGGRIHEVPIKLGLRTTPLAEHELNDKPVEA